MKPYPAETRTAFLQLRARGTSLGAISTQLSIPKSTLSDWDKQLADEISRLRAIEWEAIEEQFGRTIEQDLRCMAERIRKWEARIDRMNPDHFHIRQVLALLRETRREYFRRRAILMAPLERPSRSCSKHPDESGRFPSSSDPQPRNTNHLQQPSSKSSGSTNGRATRPHGATLESVTPDVRRGPISPGAPNDRLTIEEETTHPGPQPVGVPPSGGPSDDNTPSASAQSDPAPASESAIDSSSATPRLGGEAPHTPTRKKHKPYWLNGYYYQNPEYPEHIARAMFRRAHS